MLLTQGNSRQTYNTHEMKRKYKLKFETCWWTLSMHDLVNLCQISIQLQQAKEPLLDLPAFASASPNRLAIHYTADPCE